MSGIFNDKQIQISMVHRFPPVVNPGNGPIQVIDKNKKIPTPGPGHYQDNHFSLSMKSMKKKQQSYRVSHNAITSKYNYCSYR